MVGMVRIIVKDVKIFMILFKLFEMIVEKVLLMLLINFSCILVVFSFCFSLIRIFFKNGKCFFGWLKILVLYKCFNIFKLFVKVVLK